MVITLITTTASHAQGRTGLGNAATAILQACDLCGLETSIHHHLVFRHDVNLEFVQLVPRSLFKSFAKWSKGSKGKDLLGGECSRLKSVAITTQFISSKDPFSKKVCYRGPYITAQPKTTKLDMTSNRSRSHHQHKITISQTEILQSAYNHNRSN